MPWPVEASNEEKHAKILREGRKLLILESLSSFLTSGLCESWVSQKVSELITMFNTKNMLYYHFRALQTLTLEDNLFYNYKFSSGTIEVLQEVLDSIVF